jgi:pimeloyl-ACP methyl ester carboxylesterase
VELFNSPSIPVDSIAMHPSSQTAACRPAPFGLAFHPSPSLRRLVKESLFAALALLTVSSAIADPLPTGFGKMEIGDGANAITVFTYKPKGYTDGPLIVVFHGMLRNADVYCTNSIPLAERYKAIIAAPCFDKQHFSHDDYNLGGVIKKGVEQPRESWTYQRVPEVIDAVRQREGKPAMPYYLIGHSAGGQFAMRYAALMPPGAQRIVAANPGSDLFPRRDWEFGYGFGGLSTELSDDAALQHYLAAPLTLCLGLADTNPQHSELDRSVAAEKEGKFRLERGRACFAFAQNLAKARGWTFNWRKVEVPGIAHKGGAMLDAQEVEAALFAPDKDAAGKNP